MTNPDPSHSRTPNELTLTLRLLFRLVPNKVSLNFQVRTPTLINVQYQLHLVGIVNYFLFTKCKLVINGAGWVLAAKPGLD